MSKGRKRQYLERKARQQYVIAYQDYFDWEEPELIISTPMKLSDAELQLQQIVLERQPTLGKYYLLTKND